VDVTASGMFPVEGFGIICVDTLGSATTKLISSHRNNSPHLSRKISFQTLPWNDKKFYERSAVI
jgi:hypothetical protein